MRARPSLTILSGVAVLAAGPISISAATAATAQTPATPAVRQVVVRTSSRPALSKVFLIGAVKAPSTPALPVRAAQVPTPTTAPAPPPPDVHDPKDWVDPVADAHIISPFGWRSGRRHEGTDYKGPPHATVMAPFAGTVIQSGVGLSGYGYTVMIDHGDGIVTRLAHLASWSVDEGQHVAQGQPVGVQGQTGSASTPHVHYEIRFDGVPHDPAPYLSGD